jgi:hypothetical protein
MSDIIVGEQRESTAVFCPKCQSPSVTFLGSSLELQKRVVACGACGWGGTEDQLAQSTFKHEFKSDDEIAQAMMVDLRNLLAKNAAVTYGAFLSKWGFIDQPPSAVQLGRYMMEIAKATAKAVIELRKTLVEEKARERSGR